MNFSSDAPRNFLSIKYLNLNILRILHVRNYFLILKLSVLQEF
jgi:hypothetical protein